MLSYQPTKIELEALIKAFDQVKAENDPLIRDPDAEAFVHTSVYSEARRKRWSMVVGGKGSGKTALLLGYQHDQVDRFLSGATVNLNADDFPLEQLYNFFYSSAREAQKKVKANLLSGTDLPEFVQPAKLAQYAWQNSIKYAAVFSAGQRILKEPELFSLSGQETKVLAKACKAIARMTGDRWSLKRQSEPSELIYALLIYFFEMAQDTIDKAIGHSTESLAVLLATIALRLGRYLQARLAKPVADAAVVIQKSLHAKSVRVLVTLDKFDDYYDAFTRRYLNKPALQPHREFLASVLEGLVLATNELAHDAQFDWLSGLITLPRDKFLELHLRERVEMETAEVVWLRWTPHELLEYVERRISHALNLEHIEGAWHRLFPFDVTNGAVKKVKEDSFLYLLRHSHWRPRQVQLYLLRIFRLMDESRQPASEEMFRRAVKLQAEETIREEFHEEYLVEYPGIATTLRKLETVSLKSVMKYADVAKAISKVSLFEQPAPVDQTLLRLFHLGVLGVRATLQGPRAAQTDASIQQQRQDVAYRYYYNTLQSNPFTEDATVAFHPMFFEYLNILHREVYVVNQLTWAMFPPRTNRRNDEEPHLSD